MRTVVVGSSTEVVAMTIQRFLDIGHQVHAIITPSSKTETLSKNKFGMPATREFMLFEKMRLRYPVDLTLLFYSPPNLDMQICELIKRCIRDVEPDSVVHIMALGGIADPSSSSSSLSSSSGGIPKIFSNKGAELAQESILACVQAAIECPSLPNIIMHAPALLLDVPTSCGSKMKPLRKKGSREPIDFESCARIEDTWDHWSGQSCAPALCSRAHTQAAWQGLRALEASDLSYTVVCTGAVVNSSVSRNCGWMINIDSTTHDITDAWRVPVRTNDLADALVYSVKALSPGGSLAAWRRRVWVRSEANRHHLKKLQQERGAWGGTPHIQSSSSQQQSRRSIIKGRATEITYAICFQRQRKGVGYRHALLDLPEVRWGQVDFEAPRPASESAVRASRRMVQNANNDGKKSSALHIVLDKRRVAGKQLEYRALRAASRHAANVPHGLDPPR